jgi:hypothetical protein
VSFADWVNNGWLVAHKSSKQEIANLLGIVARDLKDSQAKDVSGSHEAWPHDSFSVAGYSGVDEIFVNTSAFLGSNLPTWGLTSGMPPSQELTSPFSPQ